MNLNPEFFCYALASNAFSAEDQTPGTLTFDERFDYALIDTDSDFECKRLVAFTSNSDLGGGVQTEASRQLPGGLHFNIRDDATGRTLFAGFADAAEIFGDGRIPFVLPTSHFFKRGGRAQVLYAPDSNISAQVWLVMVGAKHFKEAR